MSDINKQIELSIVVPLFNEEECVERVFLLIKKEMDSLGKVYEAIFIDDGSADQTFVVAQRLSVKFPQLRVIKFRRNYGQTAAMAAGFDQARGDIVITMDGDLQNDPADIKKMLAKLEEGYDVVSGWRHERKDSFFTRTLPSKIANRLISFATGIPLHDYGCSLKAYRTQFVKSIHFYSDMHRFFPALVASLSGARICEMHVNHYPRRTGRSKYGLMRIFRVASDLIVIQMITRFLKKPLYWFGILAVPSSVLGFGLLIISILTASKPEGRFLVVPSISFLVSAMAFHFILTGILAEYVVLTGDVNIQKVVTPRTISLGEE